MFKTDFIFRQQKIEVKPECLARSCHYATGRFVEFLGDTELRLFILLSSSRAFSLSNPPFSLSTPVDNKQ